jgi:hypothetical protein
LSVRLPPSQPRTQCQWLAISYEPIPCLLGHRLLRRLGPDDKVIANFRKDNGSALRKVCVRLVDLYREMGLLAEASVAIDGSRFKSVNNRDRNFPRGKMDRGPAQIEESIAVLEPA